MYHACQELRPPVELSVHLTVVATKEQDLEKLGPCHQAPAGLWGEDPPGGEVEKGHFSQNSGCQTGVCIRITWRACEYRWVLSPTPRVSVRVSGTEPKNMHCQQFSADADAVSSGTMLWEPLAQYMVGKCAARAAYRGWTERSSLFLERHLNRLCAVRGGTEWGI